MKNFLYILFIAATITSCGKPQPKPQINRLYAAAVDPVNTVISPTVIAQNPDYRFSSDAEKLKWNEAYSLIKSPSIPAANVTQDVNRQFITSTERTLWNKNASRPITDAQIETWNKTTILKQGSNIQLTPINDSTIMVSLYFPSMSTYDRDRMQNPPLGLMIYNTDTDHLNFKAKASWQSIWSN